MAALARFVHLSEAAQRLRLSVKETRAMIKSGKIQGGILPGGDMVVTEDSLPKRKEDLPEYQKYAHLKNVGIWLSQAGRKYGIPLHTIQRWVQAKYIARIGTEKNRILLNEQDVAYCAEIYRRVGSQGRHLFNPDGTPYIPKTGPLAE